MTEPFLKTTFVGDVAVLVMDDGRANTMSIESLGALSAAFQGLPASVRAVVLMGRPRFFSAGIDLDAYKEYGTGERAQHTRVLARTLLDVFTFRRPVVAGVTGHAIAGGAMLALACDARVMAAGRFQFTTNEVALGVDIPDFGLVIAEAAFPRHLFTELLLHGVTLTSEAALAHGVVAELADMEAVAERALTRAQQLAKTVGHDAYAITKRRVRGRVAERALATLEGDIEGFSSGVAHLAAQVKK